MDITQSQDKDLEAAIAAAVRSDASMSKVQKWEFQCLAFTKLSNQGAVFNNYNSRIANQAASMTIHGGQTIRL